MEATLKTTYSELEFYLMYLENLLPKSVKRFLWLAQVSRLRISKGAEAGNTYLTSHPIL